MAHPVARWSDRIAAAAENEALSPLLVSCIVMQESSGRQYAQRVERGFWRRYAAGIARWVARTASRADDRWANYPDVYASSYGLMQPMLQTAAELGFEYEFPGELFDPDTNLRIGCAKFARELRRTGGHVRRALLAYNGGSDPEYPGKVLSHAAGIQAAGLFTGEAILA